MVSIKINKSNTILSTKNRERTKNKKKKKTLAILIINITLKEIRLKLAFSQWDLDKSKPLQKLIATCIASSSLGICMHIDLTTGFKWNYDGTHYNCLISTPL